MQATHSLQFVLLLFSLAVVLQSAVAQVVIATVPVGTKPSGVAVNSVTNKIYVANSDDNTVTVIDGATNNTTTVTVGVAPYAVAVNAVTNQIYVVNICGNDVSCQSFGTVTAIDGATNNTTTVTVGNFPNDVEVNSVTNKIYVTDNCGNDNSCSSAGTVTVIDGASNNTATVNVGFFPYFAAVNSVTNMIYVTNNCGNDNSCSSPGTVTVIDGASNNTATVNVGFSPYFTAVDPVTNQIYVVNICGNDVSCQSFGTVTAIDGATNNTTTVNVDAYPYGLAVNAVNNNIYVVSNCGDDLSCGSDGTVTVIDGATNSTTDVNVGFYPYLVGVDAVTNNIYVPNYCGNDLTCTGAGTVTVIDGATNNTVPVAVGDGPQSVALNATTDRIYVPNSLDGTVSVIAGAVSGFYYLNVSPNGNGTVTSTDGFINCPGICYYLYPGHTQVTLNAAPAQGWTFTGWSGACSGTGSCVVTMTQNLSVGATFTLDYTLSVSISGNGTVTSTDGFINCPGTCSHSYPNNTQVTLNATPAQGWTFTGWSGGCGGTGSCVVTTTQNLSVTATFTQNLVYYAVSVSTSGSGTVTSTDGFINCPGTCSHPYLSNTQVTLNATPAQGWSFAAWTGACNGTGSCVGGMTQSLSVNAIFSGPLQFVATTPCRIADTRNPNGEFGGPPIQRGTFRTFTISDNKNCNIPTTAAAYSLNVTVVPEGPLGYLIVWPAGQPQPLISTLNSFDGRVKANAAIVAAGSSGAVNVYATNTTNVVLDIDGYFAPASSFTLAFYPLTPCRVADTRNPNGWLGGGYLQGGHDRDFPILDATSCNIPSGAQAYSLNFTAVPRGPLGYLTVWPAGQARPLVSTLNAPTGTVTANAAIVPGGDGGDISVYPTNDIDLVIDINGYFAAPGQGGLSLYPVAPCRVLDTRLAGGLFVGTLPVNVVGSVCAPSNTAQAYVLNATVVPTGPLGYLTLWPDGTGQPVVSTLNSWDGAVASNMAIVPTNNGSIDAYATNSTQLVLDISSYFAP